MTTVYYLLHESTHYEVRYVPFITVVLKLKIYCIQYLEAGRGATDLEVALSNAAFKST